MNIKDYKFKTELHAHTNPASPCSDFTPAEVIEKYAELKYDSIVISNHFYPGNRFRDDKEMCITEYMKDFEQALQEGQKAGINVIFGCEFRFDENFNDYLIFGIEPDFLSLAYDYMTKGIEEFSKQFRSDNTLIIQAHPFRDSSSRTSAQLLDGIEVFNMHPGANSKIGFAAKYAKENDFIITCGTDFHHEGHQGMTALLTKTEVKNSHDIVNILKSRDYLIELGGCVIFPYAR